MEFSKEQIEIAKNCKTLDEFKALARAEGLNFTEEEALNYFNSTRGGELSDDELSAVAGGGKKSKPLYESGDLVRLRQGDPTKDPRFYQGTVFSRKYENRHWVYDVKGSQWSDFVEESRLILVKKYNDK